MGSSPPLFASFVPKATTNAFALRESSRASSPCDVSIHARSVKSVSVEPLTPLLTDRLSPSCGRAPASPSPSCRGPRA